MLDDSFILVKFLTQFFQSIIQLWYPILKGISILSIGHSLSVSNSVLIASQIDDMYLAYCHYLPFQDCVVYFPLTVWTVGLLVLHEPIVKEEDVVLIVAYLELYGASPNGKHQPVIKSSCIVM